MSIPITPEQDTSAMAVMSVSEPIKGKRELCYQPKLRIQGNCYLCYVLLCIATKHFVVS